MKTKTDWIKSLAPLSQTDPRWSSVPIGGGRTIGTWGCLLTVYTMCHNAAHGTSLTPADFLAEMRTQGGITSGGNMFNGSLSKTMPLHWSNKGWLSADNPNLVTTLARRIANGVATPARVDFVPTTAAPEQHWIAIIGRSGSSYTAIDPIDGKEIVVSQRYSTRGVGGVLEILDYDALDLPIGEIVIDVSKWQGAINWERVKPHVQGVILKASEALFTDPTFWHNVTQCQKLNIPFGTYHFLRDTDPEGQARYYHGLVERTKPQAMGMWADYEACSAESLDRFVRAFESLGGSQLGIYTNLSLWRGIEHRHKSRKLWLAQYGVSSPSVDGYAMWQFSDRGGMYGISGAVDMNHIKTMPTTKPTQIDLLPFVRPPHLSTYIMRMSDGRAERYQYQHDETDPLAWYIVKNRQWEKWRLDADGVVRLVADTSPDKADDGTARYYRVTGGDGADGGLMFPRYMTVGQRYEEPSVHRVQFYDKATGRPHPQNSGHNLNRTSFISISADGQEVTVGDPNGETHTYRKGVGRIGWQSAWGSSRIAEGEAAGTWQAELEIVAGM